MKIIKKNYICFFIIFLFFLYLPIAFAESGSFLILKPSSLYVDSTMEGKKLITKRRIAYGVNNVQLNKDNHLIYQIIYPGRSEQKMGSGFVFQSREKLAKESNFLVEVYFQIPNLINNLTNYLLVPKKQIQFTGKQEETSDFPNVIWKEVNFQTKTPKMFWVSNDQGIYRPDKSPNWLNQTYPKVLKLRASTNIRNKILMGFIETGFTEQQVLLSLGVPTEKKEEFTNSNEVKWTYKKKEILFYKGKVKQIISN